VRSDWRGRGGVEVEIFSSYSGFGVRVDWPCVGIQSIVDSASTHSELGLGQAVTWRVMALM
jgi:hypothetical protein